MEGSYIEKQKSVLVQDHPLVVQKNLKYSKIYSLKEYLFKNSENQNLNICIV